MTIFVLFFTELIATRYTMFGQERRGPTPPGSAEDVEQSTGRKNSTLSINFHAPGEDHLSHSRDHEDESNRRRREEYAAQMTAIFILEFGIIFHSIFVGLTLAVAGPEFNTLYVVLVFHQTFEGLGLGSRLAAAPWPAAKRNTPYYLGVAYGLSTPIAIAVGLGVRKTYTPGSPTALLVNGVLDSISAGILIYTGLVELMAHEFIFSSEMRRAKPKVVVGACATMCLGAGQFKLPHIFGFLAVFRSPIWRGIRLTVIQV